MATTLVRDGKRCPRCEKVLARAEFYERSDGRLSSYCRRCTITASKEHVTPGSVRKMVRAAERLIRDADRLTALARKLVKDSAICR